MKKLIAIIMCFYSLSVSAADFTLGGFTETVFIVSDADAAAEFYQTVAGWEIRSVDKVDDKLKALWQLPNSASIKQIVMANKGEQRGYVRLIEITGVKQELIRSNTQSWDTGGIFDVNVRVTNMAAKSSQMQKLGWTSSTNPVQFSFGPFVVKEWIVKNADGIAFAIIERIKPTLVGWPNLKEFSRVFNSTQVVENIETSLAFYQDVLGFKTYLEHKGASKTAGPNILGLPHNITTEVERSVYIVHPQGINEGSVELLQFHGAKGRNVSNLAKPPNLGIAMLRFPVDNLQRLEAHLRLNNIDIISKQKLDLPPYGLVDILAIRTPDNTWLEFYEKSIP
jgi:catechol 2,3-dioxygenase-like lactoylglutathione lyase family enzyme